MKDAGGLHAAVLVLVEDLLQKSVVSAREAGFNARTRNVVGEEAGIRRCSRGSSKLRLQVANLRLQRVDLRMRCLSVNDSSRRRNA